MSGWCILRTSPARTLPLARSLSEAGLEVWTPTETQRRAKTRRRPAIEVDVPIMPTFVFARAGDLAEIRSILMRPFSPHPAFSVFRYGGGIPIVEDREIAGIRAAEERAKRRALRHNRKSFRIGERVTVPEGAFAGLSGIVKGGDGKVALVHFGSAIPVKIATYLLQVDEAGTDEVQTRSARTGAAA